MTAADDPPERPPPIPTEGDERMTEIIVRLSGLDERRGERRKSLAGMVAATPITAVLLAAGVGFGGYMWWFFALWAPVYALGARRLLRLVRDDRRDRHRLQELDFDIGDRPRLPS